MKRQIFVSIIFLSFFLSFGNITAQNEGYPTHLFNGCWTMRTAEDTTTKNWIPTGNGEYTGMMIYTNKSGTMLAETMHLAFAGEKLSYCSTITEQDPNNPEGEICFELTSYKDRVFTFENPKHDFPRKIIYDFSNYRKCKTHVENVNTAFDLEYDKEYDFYTAYEFKGRFIKENFVTKADRKLDDVFDYFFVIEGIKYFIKFSDSSVKKNEIDKYLNRPVHADIVFKEGLWDTDDRNVQSRIGNYISVVKVYEK
jgi:hypothetical protein